MSTQTNPTYLDAPQIIQRMYDAANDAMRVSVGSAEFVVSGDGVSANGLVVHAQSGQAVAATNCSGVKEFQLYIVAKTVTSDTLVVRLDISPDSTVGTSVWYNTSTTLTLPASLANDIVVSSILDNIIGKQMRVTITSNNLDVAEQATVYIVGNTF